MGEVTNLTAQEWRQERPSWCPHRDCEFKKRSMDKLCSGSLPEQASHDGDWNTHRLCINEVLPKGEVFDLMINKTDAWWLSYVLSEVTGGEVK